MSTALIFPGQGSQAVGMGKALAETFPVARALFDEVDAALAQNLSRLMFEGPEAELVLTANAQPALMATSLAALKVLENEAGFDIKRDVSFVAGHSLGEYSALAAAGSLSLGDATRLLRLRGSAMQRAVAPGEGAMAALLGLSFADATAVAALAVAEATEAGAVCEAANDNGGGQVVISGTRSTVERAIGIAKSKGAKRAVMLPVSAPFHCALMQPAADAMAAALAEVTIKSPIVPLVANIVALPVSDPEQIRIRLVEQVTGTVRWRECVTYMASAGVDLFVEIGAGRVLSGLVKRIASSASSLTIGTPADVEAFKARAAT